MFNDERINAECGKIYSKGILAAVLISLIYVLTRTVTLALQGELHTILTYTEAVILILGIGILSVGTFRFRNNGDERIAFEKHEFYKRSAKLFVIAVFGAYILTIPFTTSEMLGGQTHNHLLILLEVVGYLYLFYAFKTKEININYSFIAEDGWHYYSRVFSNVGFLWLGLLPPFLLAASWELILHESFSGTLTILLAYLSSSVGLSAEYFFISLIEKTSYDTIDGSRFALGTRISMLACLAVEFAAGVLQCVYVHFATGNLQNIPNFGTWGSLIAFLSLQKLRLELLSAVLVGLTVSHIMSQIKKGSLLDRVCRMEMILLALSALEATLAPLLHRALTEEMLILLSTKINSWLSVLSFSITMALWILFIYALTKELGVSRVLWVIPAVKACTSCANLFLGYQRSLFRMVTYGAHTLDMACLVLLTVILWKYSGFRTEND